MNKFEESIKQLKLVFEKMNENKEEIKLTIQKVFTKLRNEINNREDELLSEVDKHFIEESIIKENEKLPNKIKKSIEKGKSIENDWKDENNLISLINDCINIESNLNYINTMNKNIAKINVNKNIKINFYPVLNEDINNYLLKIKQFGYIKYNQYRFRKSPSNIMKERKYEINGENENIVTKSQSSSEFHYSGVICENELEKDKINRWKIKILKTKEYNIRIGITSTDFDFNSPMSDKKHSGWYYNCMDASLFSGPPNVLRGEKQT